VTTPTVSRAALGETIRPGLTRSTVGTMSIAAGRFALVLRVAVVGIVLFALAAAVRLFAIDAYVTIDESRWVQRASDFSALIDQGNLEDTFIIGHPGVTTMWTAYIGLGPERARHFSFLEGRTDATRRDGYYEALIAARRPFALIGALGVAAVALLGWRLLGAGPGILGGLLLAFEPFLVAHARVAHLDSGLTAYSAVATLSGLVFWTAGGSWPFLLLSGLATGLAFLTKAPSVYVVGFVPLTAGLSWLTLGGRKPLRLPLMAAQLLIWGALAALIGWSLWPVLRVDPIGTVVKMAQFTSRVGGGDHDNFFAGQLTDDPGLIFYPLALLFRLAPLTLIGVVLVPVLWRRLDSLQRRAVLFLALYCLGFMAMMTIGSKKFDRYLLPIFPMLGLLAGLGLWTAGRVFTGRPAMLGVLALAVAVQAATLLTVFRYPLAYYNPLLGGGAVAERLILVGWGEGLDQVGAWIGAQPRPLGEPTVATSYHRVLQAQLSGSAIPLEHVRMADYVVPYVNTLQRGAEAEVLAPFLASGTPEHVVWINGIEYARVYRGPHAPVGADLDIEIGGRVRLVRFLAAPGSGHLRPGEEVTVSLRWDRATSAQERAVVAILGSDGQVVAQDERPLGADGPDEKGQPGELHRLTVPPRTPPGTYRLAAWVLDGRSRTVLPATSAPRAGEESLLLRQLQVERAP
jgi:hypothetical protein